MDRSAGSARRAVTGSVITAVGVAALLAGLGGELALVGVGALTTFVGVSVLGPVLARPVASIFGLPLRMRGTQWRARHPQRVAQPEADRPHGVVADDRRRAGRVHHGVRRLGEDLDGRLARIRVHRDAHRRVRSDGQLVGVEPGPGRRTAGHRWCRRGDPGAARSRRSSMVRRRMRSMPSTPRPSTRCSSSVTSMVIWVRSVPTASPCRPSTPPSTVGRSGRRCRSPSRVATPHST